MKPVFRLALVGYFFLFTLPVAHAQYKCVIKGQTTYADQPCAVDAQHVGKMQDYVPPEQRIQRQRQSIKERQQRNAVESRERAEYAERDAKWEAKMQAERDAERDRNIRCADLQRRITNDKRATALYQDVGFQRSLTQRESELRQNQERFDRECRR
jgi:hypothetical protein